MEVNNATVMIYRIYESSIINIDFIIRKIFNIIRNSNYILYRFTKETLGAYY